MDRSSGDAPLGGSAGARPCACVEGVVSCTGGGGYGAGASFFPATQEDRTELGFPVPVAVRTELGLPMVSKGRMEASQPRWTRCSHPASVTYNCVLLFPSRAWGKGSALQR